MTTLWKVDWRTILVDGVAVAVNILLAFPIQAWWENRQADHVDAQFGYDLLRSYLTELIAEIEAALSD